MSSNQKPTLYFYWYLLWIYDMVQLYTCIINSSCIIDHGISVRKKNGLDKLLWISCISNLHTKLRIISRSVPGFATDSVCHVWGRGWTACLQYIPRNMHKVFALLCFVVVIHWLIFPYPPGLLHWHSGNLTIAPVPAKQPWWIWINTSCEFIMNDCITTTKQSTTKPCAYFLGYTVYDGPHLGLCVRCQPVSLVWSREIFYRFLAFIHVVDINQIWLSFSSHDFTLK